MLLSTLVHLLVASQFSPAFASSSEAKQVPLAPSPEVSNTHADHIIDEAIFAALKSHADPVAALISLQPELATELAQERLLHIVGDQKPKWMTEGDKLRLRRQGKKFVDITDHHEFYAQQVDVSSGKASEISFNMVEMLFVHTPVDLPNLMHQRIIKPLFSHVSTQSMHDVLKHMTSYYNRYYGGTYGALSAKWLHDHIAKVSFSNLDQCGKQLFITKDH
jgi:bacterial leucyl aminopeptidase